MNEESYKAEDLQEYTGILTSPDARNEKFKMELKVEDNPVLKERWTEKNVSSIELEFRYNGGPSAMFFHNRHTCPLCLENKECREFESIRKIYDIFYANLHKLQFGDTFSIQAALINNKQSVLPAEIHSFERYQPLWVACTAKQLRLDDTPEGINKKYALEQQRLQQEREAEEKRIEEEEKRIEEEERRKEEEERRKNPGKWEKLEQWLAKYPNIIKIGGALLGATVLNQILLIFKGLKYIYRLIFPN